MTQGNYQANIETLAQHHPEAWKSLHHLATGATGGSISSLPPPEDRFSLAYVQPRASMPSPSLPCPAGQEIGQIAAAQHIEENALVFIIGIGSGKALQDYLRQKPKSSLIILEPSPQALGHALMQTDLQALLTGRNVKLHTGPIDVGTIFKQEDDALRALPKYLLVHDRSIMDHPDLYLPLQRNVQQNLLHFEGRIQTAERQGPLLFQNTLSNIPLLVESASVHTLHDSCKGFPAVCVGAGPSLTKNIATLRRYAQRTLIIAVDSALKVLLEHEITPHLVATIDPIPQSFQKFRAVLADTDDLSLIWAPESYPATVHLFRGRKFIAPATNDLFASYLAPLYGSPPPFQSVLSVFMTAIQSALVAGCGPIIFMGADLALAGDKDHADGVPVEWRLNETNTPRTLVTEGWAGGQVQTVPALKSQLLVIEQFISRQHVTFLNATEGGARIQTARSIPLDNVLAEHCRSETDFHGRIRACWQNGSKPSLPALQEATGKIENQMARAQKLCRTGYSDGQQALNLWKKSKISAKKQPLLSRFQQKIISAGETYESLATMTELTNALFPLRVREHHLLVYDRLELQKKAAASTPEERIFNELELNIRLFSSLKETLSTTLSLVQETRQELAFLAKGSMLSTRPEQGPATPKIADLFSHFVSSGSLWHQRADLQRLRLALKAYAALPPAIRPDLQLLTDLLLLLQAHAPAVAPEEISAEHQRWVPACVNHLLPRMLECDNSRDPDRPLRIGYLLPPPPCPFSAFPGPVLAAHDKDKFTIICYSSADASRLPPFPEHILVRDTGKLSDAELSACIKQDTVDILVDLVGNRPGNRLAVLARKPAPLQVSWLDYPDVTALPTMDYRLTDHTADPEELPPPQVTDDLYGENLIRLPHGFLGHKPPPESPDISPLPALRNGHLTFLANVPGRYIYPETVTWWAEVLEAFPESRLLVRMEPRDKLKSAQKLLRDTLQKQGLARKRLSFLKPLPGKEQLSQYGGVDAMLESVPYSSPAVIFEALWMGVPLLLGPWENPAVMLKKTRYGRTIVLTGPRRRLFPARLARSVLRQAQLDILIDTIGDSMNIPEESGHWLQNLEFLQRIRQKLRDHLMNSPAMNPVLLSKSLEDAYRRMWRSWCLDQDCPSRPILGQGAEDQ